MGRPLSGALHQAKSLSRPPSDNEEQEEPEDQHGTGKVSPQQDLEPLRPRFVDLLLQRVLHRNRFAQIFNSWPCSVHAPSVG